ncbi:MAG: LPS export ABC transporter permease LptF [Proteobacteria bacterium]|nr:LPS export ABC transporter permease LptF [Pseudomonadota bacterium]
MQILGKYLRKETLKAFLVILIILFLVSVGVSFTGTLRLIARGVLPASMLYVELGLTTINILTILVPLSLYLGVLSKLAQMYRNQELVMFHASGISSRKLLNMFAPQMLFFFVFILLLSLFVVPLASRTSEQLTLAASKDVSLMGLKEGVFQELSGSNSVIYVRKINTQENRLENIFLNIRHQDRVDTLTAEFGYQYEDEQTKERYISLYNGFRNEGVPGSKKYQLMSFARNDIKLPKLKGKSVDVDEEGKTIVELLNSNRLIDQAELHKRIAPAIVVMVLVLLALSISKTSPREGKYGSLLLGLLIYIAYLILLTIAVSLIAQGKVSAWLGAWWVHIMFITYGFWRIHKADKAVD